MCPGLPNQLKLDGPLAPEGPPGLLTSANVLRILEQLNLVEGELSILGKTGVDEDPLAGDFDEGDPRI